MASLVLGTIGSSLGGPVGGFIGSAIGSYIDQALFAPSPPDVEGPRLQDTSAIRADPGTPIPILAGADRLPGIVIDSTNLIETKHKEKVGGKGGKSSTHTSYTYHVDIDYMLCEGPILGVGRIWADGKLIRGTRYALSLATDDNPEKVGGIPYSDWYLDKYYSEDQVPWSLDPSYTPTISAQKYTYDPVTDTYSTISDVDAEAVLNDPQDVTVIYAQDTATGFYIPVPASHAYTGERVREPETFELVDAIDQTFPSYDAVATANADPSATDPLETTPNNTVSTFYTVPEAGPNGGLVTLSGNTQKAGWGSVSLLIGLEAVDDDGNRVPDNRTIGDGNPYEGVPNVAGLNVSTANQAEAYTLQLYLPPGTTRFRLDWNMAVFLLLFAIGRTVDSEFTYVTEQTQTQTVQDPVRDWEDYENLYDALNDWSPKAVLDFYGADGVALYRGTDDQISDPTMQLAHEDQIDCDVPAYIGRAHIVFQRLELERFGNRIPNLTFETVHSDNARIGPFLTRLMERAEIESDLYDITALPDAGVPSQVLGYTLGRATSLRAAIEPLLEAFQIDVAEMGDQLVFRPKQREFDHTIDYTDLAAIDAGSTPNEPISLQFRDAVEMPKRLTVRYRDPERDYQLNTAPASRQFGRSIQESSTEIAAVLPPAVAKVYARDKLRDLWLERRSGRWTTPHKYMYVSPSDRVYIDGRPFGKPEYVFKVTAVSRGANGILSMDGVLTDVALYVPVPGETDAVVAGFNPFRSQRTNSAIVPSLFIPVNLPPLRGSDDDAGFYYFALGDRASWPGAAIYRRPDSAAAYSVLEIVTDGGVYGQVRSGALSFVDNNGKLDRVSSIEVQLANPTDVLASVTPADLLNKGNVAMIGDEIVQFMTVVDNGGGSFTLSDFIRGQLDTDTAAIYSGHTTLEQFFLLQPGTLKNYRDQLSNAFAPLDYKAVTLGGQLSQFTSRTFTNTAERLRPFRPKWVTATRNGSNDVTITWYRQDRLGAATWPDGGDVPMSEDDETYEVDVWNPTRTSILETYTVTGSRELALTDAQVTGLGYSSGALLEIDVYQTSTTVGRGRAAQELV